MANIPLINSYWSPTTFNTRAKWKSKENKQERDIEESGLKEELISKLEY